MRKTILALAILFVGMFAAFSEIISFDRDNIHYVYNTELKGKYTFVSFIEDKYIDYLSWKGLKDITIAGPLTHLPNKEAEILTKVYGSVDLGFDLSKTHGKVVECYYIGDNGYGPLFYTISYEM